MESPNKIRRSKAPKTRGKIIKKILFTFCALFLFLAVLDFSCWIYLRRNWYFKIFRPDNELIYSLRPGGSYSSPIGGMTPGHWKPEAPRVTVKVNQDGYRGKPVPLAKQPGEFRVICMGDSITMGLDVEEDKTYCALLQKMLSEKMPGRKVTTINGGVISYTSRQGIYLFIKKFLAYKPDMVIWAYGFNDQSPLIGHKIRDVDLIPIAPGAEAPIGGLKKNAIMFIIHRPTLWMATRVIGRVILQARAAKFMERLGQIDKSKLPAPKSTEKSFENSKTPPGDFRIQLLYINDLARENNFRMVVLHTFGTSDVYGRISERFARENDVPYIDFAQIFMSKSILAGQGKFADQEPYKSMLERYEPFMNPGMLEKWPLHYLTTDNLHPNDLGHHLIATELTKTILEQTPRR